MADDRRRNMDQSGDPDPVAEDALTGENVDSEKPIEVKRTPRLRSGKHEEPESAD